MPFDTLISIPANIAATADGLSHEIQFSAEFNDRLGVTQLAFITVVSGTFKFNSGGPCSETNASYTAKVDQPIPFINGVQNIQYQCTSAGNFNISACRDAQ